MLRAVKRQFFVQWEEWTVMGVVALAGTILGMGMFYLLRSAEGGSEGYFPIGTMLGCILAVIYSALSVMTGIGNYFNMEISMGCTRREFFLSYFAVSFFFDLLGVLWMSLLYAAESALVRILAPGLKIQMQFLPCFWKVGIPAALAIPMISGFCGALVMRFGKKAFWVLWTLWMIAVLGGPRIAEAVEEAPNSIYGVIGGALASLGRALPGNVWALLGAAVSLACFAGTYLLLRKQSVTS